MYQLSLVTNFIFDIFLSYHEIGIKLTSPLSSD